MRIVLLLLALFWIVPIMGVAITALVARLSPRARTFLRRTFLTG